MENREMTEPVIAIKTKENDKWYYLYVDGKLELRSMNRLDLECVRVLLLTSPMQMDEARTDAQLINDRLNERKETKLRKDFDEWRLVMCGSTGNSDWANGAWAVWKALKGDDDV